MNDRPQGSFYDNYENIDSIQIGPFGTLRPVRHLTSGEVRALKMLNPDIASNRAFQGWLAAGLRVATQLAEHLRSPLLVAPIRPSEGKELIERNGEFYFERYYFRGSKNLEQFVEEHKDKDSSPGIPEEVALSIMKLLVGTIRDMHSAKITGPDGGPLSGIPHLNLKPENILIGKDHRSNEWQVRVTDFCVASSSPLLDKFGISSRLNYTWIEALEDPAYFGLYGDIFSLGLILYRLLENKDLIPAGQRRESTITFIRTELPGVLNNLQLKKARGATKNILVQCLNSNVAERYGSIETLYDQLSKIAPKNPAERIKQFVEAPVKVKVDVKPFSVKAKEWGQKNRSLLIKGGGAIVLLFAAWGIYSFVGSQEEAGRRELWETARTKSEQTLSTFPMGCDVGGLQTYFRSEIEKATRTAQQGEWETAANSADATSRSMETAFRLCGQIDTLEMRWNGRAPDLPGSPALAELSAIFDTEMGLAKADLSNLQFASCQSHVDSSYSLVDSLYRVGVVVDTAIPRKPCEDEVAKMRTVVNGLNRECRSEGLSLLERMRSACESDDQYVVERSSEAIYALQQEQRCLPQPKVEEPPKDTVPKETPVENQKQIAEKYLGKAENDLRVFEAKYPREKYISLPCYIQAIDDLERAKVNFKDENFDATINRAQTAINGIAQCRPPEPCPGMSAIRDSISRCVELLAIERPELKQRLDYVDQYIKNGQCGEARADLQRLAEDAKCDSEKPCASGDCWKWKTGDLAAWDCCRRVPKSDPNYQLAQKYTINALAKAGLLGPEYRPLILQSYRNAGSTIDERPTEENVTIWIVMAWCYAADTGNIDYRNAVRFVERAKSGTVSKENEQWWRALLVDTRCSMKKWRETGIAADRVATRERAQKFLDYAIAAQDAGMIDLEIYMREVRHYLEQLRN